MKTLITATGKRLDVTGGAPSTIDGVLRFWTIGYSVSELNDIFDGKPSECATLTLDNDGIQTVFTGYSQYLGALRDPHESEVMISFYVEE